MAHQRLFVGSIVGISGLAWLALWLWAFSPYARYLDHGDGTQAWNCRLNLRRIIWRQLHFSIAALRWRLAPNAYGNDVADGLAYCRGLLPCYGWQSRPMRLSPITTLLVRESVDNVHARHDRWIENREKPRPDVWKSPDESWRLIKLVPRASRHVPTRNGCRRADLCVPSHGLWTAVVVTQIALAHRYTQPLIMSWEPSVEPSLRPPLGSLFNPDVVD
jgi:hypothetical protein